MDFSLHSFISCGFLSGRFFNFALRFLLSGFLFGFLPLGVLLINFAFVFFFGLLSLGNLSLVIPFIYLLSLGLLIIFGSLLLAFFSFSLTLIYNIAIFSAFSCVI